MLEVGNATEVSLNAQQTIPFTLVSYDTNADSHFDTSTNSMIIDRSGYYIVSGNFTFAPTSTGDASIYLYVDGEELPTATATFTCGEAEQKFNFVIAPKVVRTVPTFLNSTVPVKFVVSAAGTLYNANAVLIRTR